MRQRYCALCFVGQTITYCRLPSSQATENDGLRHISFLVQPRPEEGRREDLD